MKKLYNRTALFHARAIVGLFALCLLALPSPALAQAIDLKLTNVTVKEAIEALNQRENYSVAIKSAGVDMQRRQQHGAERVDRRGSGPDLRRSGHLLHDYGQKHLRNQGRPEESRRG